VLAVSIGGLEESHAGLGLLRIRILGLKEFSARHGANSAVPFLRTSAQTIRHSLSAEDFLGRWGDEEFIAILHTSSPVSVAGTAELIWRLLSQSEISWWGDRFLVEAVVGHAVARAGDSLESLLQHMTGSQAAAGAKAAGAGPGAGPRTG